MKRMLLSVMAAVLLSVGLTATVKADDPHTDVTGVVTDENHVAVSGAHVEVLCEGHTGTDTTDARGSYLVSYPTADCPFGVTVRVTASKAGKSGVASGTVRGITTKLNLAIVDVSIPEYGVIGAITAAGAGIGLIAYNRRRRPQLQF